jgi:hypothetical protein
MEKKYQLFDKETLERLEYISKETTLWLLYKGACLKKISIPPTERVTVHKYSHIKI